MTELEYFLGDIMPMFKNEKSINFTWNELKYQNHQDPYVVDYPKIETGFSPDLVQTRPLNSFSDHHTSRPDGNYYVNLNQIPIHENDFYQTSVEPQNNFVTTTESAFEDNGKSDFGQVQPPLNIVNDNDDLVYLPEMIPAVDEKQQEYESSPVEYFPNNLFSGVIPHAINIQINIPPSDDRKYKETDSYREQKHLSVSEAPEYVSALGSPLPPKLPSYNPTVSPVLASYSKPPLLPTYEETISPLVPQYQPSNEFRYKKKFRSIYGKPFKISSLQNYGLCLKKGGRRKTKTQNENLIEFGNCPKIFLK